MTDQRTDLHYGRRFGDHHISPATLAVALLLGIQMVTVFTLLGMFQGLSAENQRIVKEHNHLKDGMYQVANRCYEITKALAK
jgi:hypothetical protein